MGYYLSALIGETSFLPREKNYKLMHLICFIDVFFKFSLGFFFLMEGENGNKTFNNR